MGGTPKRPAGAWAWSAEPSTPKLEDSLGGATRSLLPISEYLPQRFAIGTVLGPPSFTNGKKYFYKNGTAAFEKAANGRKDSQAKKLENKISHLHTKLSHKDEVIAEIMADHVRLKKKSWRGLKNSWAEPDVRDEVSVQHPGRL